MARKLMASLAAALTIVGAVAGAVELQGNFATAAQLLPAVHLDSAPVQTGRAAPVLTEAQAHQAVWALPRVQRTAALLRSQGVRPFTMTEATPDPQARTGTLAAAYIIYFGEDHLGHVVRIQTYTVDAHTGKVGVYGPFTAK